MGSVPKRYLYKIWQVWSPSSSSSISSTVFVFAIGRSVPNACLRRSHPDQICYVILGHRHIIKTIHQVICIISPCPDKIHLERNIKIECDIIKPSKMVYLIYLKALERDHTLWILEGCYIYTKKLNTKKKISWGVWPPQFVSNSHNFEIIILFPLTFQLHCFLF